MLLCNSDELISGVGVIRFIVLV